MGGVTSYQVPASSGENETLWFVYLQWFLPSLYIWVVQCYMHYCTCMMTVCVCLSEAIALSEDTEPTETQEGLWPTGDWRFQVESFFMSSPFPRGERSCCAGQFAVPWRQTTSWLGWFPGQQTAVHVFFSAASTPYMCFQLVEHPGRDVQQAFYVGRFTLDAVQ